MEAILATGLVEPAGIADPSAEMIEAARKLAPDATVVASIEELLALGLDGLVIATPSALHAAHCHAALSRGVAVFCQKPLGRTAAEAREVVDAARAADRLLEVDFSYRHSAGMQAIKSLVAAGSIGPVHAIDLVFHNAYGPDKAWFYDLTQSGGGCIIDLGVHLVDLALWVLDFPMVTDARGTLFARGRRLATPPTEVEDFSVAELSVAGGAIVRLACSWKLSAGQNAVIEASFFGTEGGAGFRNLNGSFYDFVAERFDGTTRTILAAPPDEWGGRAAADWAHRLAAGEGFAAEVEEIVTVARILDRIYGR
jgi:predicted dehydrogenase